MAEQILERVGLKGHSKREVSTLAYGDKHLIEIAIVLARRPRLVLLDEPTAGMKPEESDRMIALVKELSEDSDTTFFITEHDMKVVFSVYVIDKGVIRHEGKKKDLLANTEVQSRYLSV